MIPDDPSNAATQLLADALPSASEITRSRLLLMRQLYVSLCSGHRALLALDLVGIERSTMEQAELGRKLAEYIPRGTRSTENSGNKKRRPAENRARGFAACAPEMEAELRRGERDVLQALRLQGALLVRAQHKLRVIANMLADPSVSYGPPSRPTARLQSASRSKMAGSI